MPLQFLSELGLVGFLLYLGLAARRSAAPCARAAIPLRSRSGSPSPSSSPTPSSTSTGTSLPPAGPCSSSRARCSLGRTPPSSAPAPPARRDRRCRVRARRHLLTRGTVARAAQLACHIARTGEARALVRPALGRRAHGLGRVRGRGRQYGSRGRAPSRGRGTRAGECADVVRARLVLLRLQAWALAYAALNNSYTYDRFGPASKTCGLLDQARTKATGYTPPSAQELPRITTVFEPLRAARASRRPVRRGGCRCRVRVAALP